MRAYLNSTQRYKYIFSESEEQKATRDNPPEEINPDNNCPICFELMNTKELLDCCKTCRKFIHLDCLRRWLDRSRTCVYCRSNWEIPSSTKCNLKLGGRVIASQMGDYLNIS